MRVASRETRKCPVARLPRVALSAVVAGGLRVTLSAAGASEVACYLLVHRDDRKSALALIHAEFFSIFGTAVAIGTSMILFGTRGLDALAAIILSLGFSTAFNMIGLWLDTAWPRLSWDNPIAALKQNPNAVIVILGDMGLLGGMGALAFALKLPRYGYALLFGSVFILVIALWTLLFPHFMARRYTRLGD